MPEMVITLTRKQLYDEIWELSIAGVAKKYDIPYPQMMQQVKAAKIAYPPSGYWTKLAYGKPVEKTELSGNGEEEIALYKEALKTKKKKQKLVLAPPEVASVAQPSPETKEQEEFKTEAAEGETPVAEQRASSLESPLETVECRTQMYNIFHRYTLYKAVWQAPVTEVAKKYQVSDVSIHKVCKSLDIPTPPADYWTKLRAGKKVAKLPLPRKELNFTKWGLQNKQGYKFNQENGANLDFLSEEDRAIVLAVACQIILPDEDDRMHTAITAHRKIVTAWEKEEKKNPSTVWQKRNGKAPPYLAGRLSEDSIPRVCHLLDALIKAMEPLGCKLNSDLSFMVNGETVKMDFTEAKTEVKHVPTKEENLQLLKYEEERKRYSYASKPKIPKYDHQFNGHLTCVIDTQTRFRDCKSYRLEDKLGEMMLELYVAAERIHQARLAREEAEHQRQEEARRKDERRKRYNQEVNKTLALVNEAEDFDKACKIRAYVAAYQAIHAGEDISQWAAWANAKADWYDPSISKEDELLGKREHGKSSDEKGPKHIGYWR